MVLLELFQHLNTELDEEMNKVVKEKGITANDLALDAHFENRIEHRQRLRKEI